MSHVLTFSQKDSRAIMLLIAVLAASIPLAAGSSFRGNIADLIAGKPLETAAYPGAVSYKTTTDGLFGCELEEVTSRSYRTADPIEKVSALYQQRGFTVIRDDSIKTCCISKMSYVLSGRQNGSNVYVTLESPWFDGEKRFRRDTLIVVASAQKPKTAALRAKR